MSEKAPLNEGFQAYLCPGCDLLVTEASHDLEDVKRINRETYRLPDMIRTYFLREKELHQKYGAVLETVKNHVPAGWTGPALEIGSNIGFFTNYLRSRGIEIVSVELNPELRESQRLLYGIPSLPNLDRIPAGTTFDVVFLLDVLEHIPSPAEFLRKLRNVLTEEGILLVQCPNKNAWSARLCGPEWHWWLAPDHLFHFSDRSLRLLAECAGFKILSVKTVSPLVEELAALPRAGFLFSPLMLLNRCIALNRFVRIRNGMLLQAVLRPR